VRAKPPVISLLLAIAATALGQGYWIQSHEIPLVPGSYGWFSQNPSMFLWQPFDSTRTHWDLTMYPSGMYARVGLKSADAGRPPAPDTMANDAPASQVCVFDTAADNSVRWSYLYKDDFGLKRDGIDFDRGYRFLGNYYPDEQVWVTPIYPGAAWFTNIYWYCDTAGVPYVANERHRKQVVATGKVKVPMSGEYYWPCYVVRDSMAFIDEWTDTRVCRWIYEWLVPGHFLGGRGVAAAMSQNGAASDFENVEQMLQIGSASIPGWDLTPPTFSGPSIIPDTSFAGPFVLSVNITDDDAVEAESVFYRVDGAAWQSIGADSSSGSGYHFTIPEVTAPAQVDYYFWAKDEFSVTDSIDCWTTWPVCSPESTFIRFNATGSGVGSSSHLQPGDSRLTVAPNPFRSRTRFQLPRYGVRQAEVRIYSVAGELVRALDLAPGADGLVACWDGRGLGGSLLPGGAYIYRLQAQGYRYTGKLLLNR